MKIKIKSLEQSNEFLNMAFHAIPDNEIDVEVKCLTNGKEIKSWNLNFENDNHSFEKQIKLKPEWIDKKLNIVYVKNNNLILLASLLVKNYIEETLISYIPQIDNEKNLKLNYRKSINKFLFEEILND